MILRSACISVVWCIGVITSLPAKVLNNIADNFDSFDGSFPGYDGPPPIDILSNSIGDDFFGQPDKVDYGVVNKNITTEAKQNDDTIIRIIDLVHDRDALGDNYTEPFLSKQVDNSTNSTNNTVISQNITDSEISIFNGTSSEEVDAYRSPRQQSNATDDDPEFKSKESEEESSEEEENMLTGLLSAFLGGLSTPEGGIDLDAILGLLGSLSTQNPDGTYDFQGLTDLLRGLFGGGEGSDIGAFTGGLIGAIIKGIAVPPGPKGAGKLAGKVVAGVLPALSGPPDTQDGEDMMEGWNKPSKPTIDLGGFLSGFFKTSASGSAGGDGDGKLGIIKAVISAIKSLATSSSASSSGTKDWS
ncbi:unnamed protein product [Callosobruchus maculatus]|uniref:Uncharacterized protein n=1 Tax=Callosobruchus maculatus TaxID=64391 RepID=A0A653DJ96_CALMS|nr:unnamed protein product [Callosobruchus maculatus]